MRATVITTAVALGLIMDMSTHVNGFSPSSLNRMSTRSTSTSTSSLHMSSALIVQNKGGGHGELGFQLAQVLQRDYSDKITSVTILQDDACNMGKEPFKSYVTDIPDVTIITAPMADPNIDEVTLQAIMGRRDVKFDYIWDNYSKDDQGAGRILALLAKKWDTKLYTYVSSAGMYQPTKDTVFPMDESTPIKSSAGQNLFDKFAAEELSLPYVSFRPQYIYGPKANKYDYIDWYFDRLVRELPLPIPDDGKQKVSLSNSEDVAALLASVLNDEEAAKQQRFFNCGTDQLLTYDDVAYLCAEAAGIPKDKVMIEHYDHQLLGKATFPFRMTDFYVSPDMAKQKLSWKGATHSLKDDLKWYYESYVQRGGPTKKMDLMKDWEIVVGCKTSFNVGSIYEKWDPLIIESDDVKELNADK